MDKQLFSSWFDQLCDIWQNKKPQGIVEICADEFKWYETPFS